MDQENNVQDIEERTFNFAVRCVKMVLQLPRNNIATWKLGGQLIDSSTSINSNIVQARAALSKADFTNHMRISRKEAKESQRWIEMLIALDLISKERSASLLKECTEIVSILFVIVKTAEKNQKRK